MKPSLFRPAAKQDVRDTVRYYRREAGEQVALRLVAHFERERRLLERHPGVGSLRIGQELGLARLRTWRVKGFPLLLVYVERDDYVDVIRVLGERQDVLAILRPMLDEAN